MIELYDIEEVKKTVGGMAGFIFPCPNKCGTTYATSLLAEDRKDINTERICSICGVKIRETEKKIFIIDDEKWLKGEYDS